MLKENPDLYQLYKDLVKGGIITAEEFWENRKIVSYFLNNETTVKWSLLSEFFCSNGTKIDKAQFLKPNKRMLSFSKYIVEDGR